MTFPTQPSVLITSKAARIRYLFRVISETLFLKDSECNSHLESFLDLANDPEVDKQTLVELQLNWMEQKKYRKSIPQDIETEIEKALNEAVISYAVECVELLPC